MEMRLATPEEEKAIRRLIPGYDKTDENGNLIVPFCFNLAAHE